MDKWVHFRSVVRPGEWSYAKVWELCEVRIFHNADKKVIGMQWEFYGKLASPYKESEYDRKLSKFYDEYLDKTNVREAMPLIDTYVTLEGWNE